MGQKINPNLFNKTQNKESKFINKKSLDYSILTSNNVELKIFIQNFFLKNNIIINNCKLLHFSNLFYIYISYKQKIKNTNLLKFNKIQIIKNFFNKKKIKIKHNNYLKKKSFENLNCVEIYKKVNPLKKYYKESIIDSIEICLFIKKFFNNLTNFKPNKFKFNMVLTLEKQNNKLTVLKKKEVLLKRKQKLAMLRKYKSNKFFNEGINLLLATITAKNSSKFLGNFLSSQFKILNFHNFLIRFVKNTLILLNSKIFLCKIKGIKIVIKGRFNGNLRAKKKLIQIGNLPQLQTKKLNIDYFENTAYTTNGTFGIKIWVY